MLEELGLEYDAHTVDISTNDQFTDWFKVDHLPPECVLPSPPPLSSLTCSCGVCGCGVRR